MFLAIVVRKVIVEDLFQVERRIRMNAVRNTVMRQSCSCKRSLSTNRSPTLPAARVPQHIGHGQVGPHLPLSHFVRRDFAVRSNKSWSEIAADAADVAKSALTKIKDTAASVVGGLSPRRPQEKDLPEYRPRSEADFPVPKDLFGGGIMGRMMGGLVTSAIKAVSEQVAASAKESNAAYNEAARKLRSSSKLKSRLGDAIEVGPALSQSVSSAYINGRSSKQIQLLVPVYGVGGRAAQAVVQVQEAAGQPRNFDITVRLPEGDSVRITGSGDDDSGSGEAGRTIDVEYWEVKQ